MSSSENNSTSNPNSKSKSKRWFKKPSHFQSKPSSSKKDIPTNAGPSSSNASTVTAATTTQASASTSTTMPASTYAPSTYTTSTTTTLKPLIPGRDISSSRSRSRSKSSKAWSKTKDFLSSLGEPPTAQYDREQMMKGETKIKTDGREAFGAINYGPYGAGGTFSGRL